MTERDPSQWRRGGEPPEGDSIAGRLASRIDAVPPSPGDAMDWAAVAARYEREATSLGETQGAAELLFEAGRIYEERLGDPQAALGFYRRAFAAGPHFVPNLRALARLGDERGDETLAAEVRGAEVELPQGAAPPAGDAVGPATAEAAPALPEPARPIALALASAQAAAAARDGAALVEACERCAEATAGEDGRRSAHHLLAGSAVAEGTGALERAAALALRAFERCPDDPLVRSAARLHAARARDLVHLAEILRADARAATGAGSARSLLELARVEERLGHGDQAVASLEEAWTAAPDDPRVLSELARLREARGEWEAASDALEGLAAAHAAHDGAGHRHEAVAVKLRRIELEEVVLQRVEEATRSCHEVLAMEPGNRTALATLGRLAARTGDWDAALANYRAEAEAARDPAERAQRTLKAAQLLEERLGRVPEAIEGYRAALAQDPLLLAARSALERLLEREGRWEDLRRLLEGDLAPGATPAEEVETLFRLARLEEDRLGDTAAAAARLRRILELEPENAGALRQLHQSLERAGSAAELAGVLQEEARLATSPRRRQALLERRAEVLEELLQDPGRASEAWEELRAAFPDDPAALRALGRLHAAAGRWEQVVATFRSQAEFAPDPVQAAELLLRAADLEERRLSRPDEAVRLYREALTLEPSYFPALLALSRLYRTQDEPEPLAELLLELASTREEPGERAAALVELGQLCEERLADPARALEAYGEALQADPRHLAALRASERLLVGLGRTDELAALRRAALGDEEAGDRTERLLRLAWQELARPGDPAEAQGVVRAVVAAAPDSPSATLLELYLADEPARRAQALAALGGEPPAPPAPPPAPSPEVADAAPAPAATAAMPPAGEGAAQAAATTASPPEVHAEVRAEVPAASEPQPPASSPAGASDPAHPGDPAELARLSEARLAAASDPGSRAAWAVQAGEAWERAGELGRALTAYQAALSAAPAHLPALRAARNVFARQRDWGAVRATLQAEGETLTDGHEAAAAWREAGAIAEQWFGDVEGAVEDYRAALHRDPGDPVALTRVEALLAPSGLAELAEVHAARARADKDPHRAAEAWLAAARSSLSGPEGRKAALTHLDEALQRHPDHAAALELRARLRAQAGQPSLALDDLERCLALGGEPATQLPLRLAAAALCEEKLQDDPAALRHTEAALALVPESTEALARLAHLHRTAARLPSSAAALQRLLAVPDLPREAQIEHGFALASVQADLGDPEAGLASCRRVLDLDPGHPGALELQVELERRGGDPGEPAAAPSTTETGAREVVERGEARLETPRPQSGARGSRTEELEHLRAAIELDPGRDDLRATLADLAEETLPGLALDQHRRLLARDPARAASWTALFRLHTRSRSHDGAFVAATVLRWMGAPVPGPGADHLLLEGDRQNLAAPPPLAPGDLDLLRAPGDRGPLADVVAVAGDALATALVDPRETRGAPVRSDHPFRRVLNELGRALGAGDFELYAAPLGRLTVEPGSPAAVRVGADLARRSTLREQRFLLGRAAARLRTRSALAEAFPEDLADAVGAAVRVVVPGYLGLGQLREELSRRLEKALSRKARRALDEPARAFARLRPVPDLPAWRAATTATADRAGLVLCGDLPTALDLLLRDGSGHKPAPADRLAALGAHPEAQALLAFAATAVHLVLRQKLRVAIA